jgi:FkbM family methyltransferase
MISRASVKQKYDQAILCYEQGQIEQAQLLLTEIIAWIPDYVEAFSDLGALLFQKGEIEVALSILNRASELDKNNINVANNIASILDFLNSQTGHANTATLDPALQEWEKSIFDVTQKVADRILEYLPEDGVFLDVGANVGLITAQILAKKQPKKCYLFEPVNRYYNYCKQKFTNNPLVSVENLALSDQTGSLSICIDHQNLGWNTIVSAKRTEGMHEEIIQTISFDEYARRHNINRIDVIKIDVEGWEFKVLKGMQQTLKRLAKKPVIICEVGWGPGSHPFWEEEKQAFEWLFQNGYERTDYNVPGTSDVIFLPKRSDATAIQYSAPKRLKSHLLPRITLGIPTRNRLEPLLVLLDSIAKQTYQNFDLIISDDGDKYDLNAEIKKYLPKLEFRVVKGPCKNLPSNRQCIIDNAHTEIVAMCDDDHFMEPNCLEQLVKTISSSEQIGIVSAIWPNPNEKLRTLNYNDVKDQEEFLITIDNIDIGSHFWWKNGTDISQIFQTEPKILEMQTAGGGCLIYRKTAVQIAGGFPQDLSVISFREDSDMSYRMFLKGYKVLLNPIAVAYHLREKQGGCRDAKDVRFKFVEDGLNFLEKLVKWREGYQQIQKIKASPQPIRILTFYDEEGWAWWNRSHQLQKNIDPKIHINVVQIGQSFAVDDYDFILVYEHYLLEQLRNVPPEKIILANSCPRYIQDTLKVFDEGRCYAVFANNYDAFLKIRERNQNGSRRFFCCQNGVDTELFYPKYNSNKQDKFVACWTGHSQSIGNKGLEIIREACKEAGVELLTIDAKDKAPGVKAQPQEWVRDNLYHQASVLLCASEFEGTPNPALEAMACGLPVISTNVGNMPELIVNGYNGYLVERSVAAFVEALLKLKNQDHLKLGEHARLTIENGWSWRSQVKKYEEMIYELSRERSYGALTPEIVSQKQIAEVAITVKMGDTPQSEDINDYILKKEGKFTYISSDILPYAVDNSEFVRSAKLLSQLPKFFLHFGGIGDALLMLSTFYDQVPHQTVFSCATSANAATSFFSQFPELKEIYVCDFSIPDGPVRHLQERFLRLAASQIENCLGRGSTPIEDHDKEWTSDIDIFTRYGISESPNWVEIFPVEQIINNQVILAPQGSTMGMNVSKRNIVPYQLWEGLILMLNKLGFNPVILGTPEESQLFPKIGDSIDRRSYSFSEQMGLIRGSKFLVGADSWAKTFSALAQVPTFVFPPIYSDGRFQLENPSANIFLKPWKSIKVITSLEELLAGIQSLMFEEIQRSAPDQTGVSIF